MAAYISGDETAVATQVVLVAQQFPARTRKFIWDAEREVGQRFCSHEGLPPVLVGIGNSAAHKEEAKNYRGLFDVHHAEAIAGVEAGDVAARGNGSAQRGFRNQVPLFLHIYSYTTHVSMLGVRVFCCCDFVSSRTYLVLRSRNIQPVGLPQSLYYVGSPRG